MKKFTKTETKIISTIFIVLIFFISINILVSLRKGRDANRKNDISAMQGAVDTYLQKYREFPKSTVDGKIIGCFNEDPRFDPVTDVVLNAIPCECGVSTFENIKVLSRDPSFAKGRGYLYISDGDKYEIYVSLEGKNEAEYDKSVVVKNLQCGSSICNYGKWSN